VQAGAKNEKLLTGICFGKKGEFVMFNHILCPTDLKKRALLALKKALQIAHQFDSKITLLNVHDELMNKKEREMLRVSFDKLKDKYRDIAVSSKAEMKATIVQLHAEDIEVEYLLREGKPEKAIIDVAEKLEVDLIVICTDGHPHHLRDVFTGTITEHVVNNAVCPVLVVPFK
jgi:nucleotide-binding universal stress UspA family protein